jgi:GT2 family glycosyltransferase
LCYQDEKDFDIIISDQSDKIKPEESETLRAVRMVLESRGHRVTMLKNLPFKGLAQQRQFLLDHADTPFVLYLDDDLILEPYVLKNLLKIIRREKIGFAGSAVIGLSFKNDYRPHQQAIEFWDGEITPELITPESEAWKRYLLHNAANPLHLQEKFNISPESPVPYKIAWVGGCVLYDTDKLRDAGAFEFWKDLPEKHCGEDVLAQLRVMRKSGGCGVLPSGVYHQELETTVPERKINAPEYLEI